jgi:hypothetical protein
VSGEGSDVKAKRPEWVGEGEGRRDVSHLTDRGVATMALDVVLHLGTLVKTHSDKLREFLDGQAKTQLILLNELPSYAKRLDALETVDTGINDRLDRHHKRLLVLEGRAGPDGTIAVADVTVPPSGPSIPGAPPMPLGVTIITDDDPEPSSIHEWNEILQQAGATLSRRVKNPQDRAMTSQRAAAIARQVFTVVETEGKAASYDAWQDRLKRVAIAVAKWILPLILGALAAKYGLAGK